MREGERDRVDAKIYIHRDANKHLARICIAHELYHLLLELDVFLASNRKQWGGLSNSTSVEHDCNQFAWQLCLMHECFNRDRDNWANHILFPKNMFNTALTTHDARRDQEWPSGISLDQQNRFWQPRLPALKPYSELQ
jgi:hypothetical protein